MPKLLGLLSFVAVFALQSVAHSQQTDLLSKTFQVDWDGAQVAIPVAVSGSPSDDGAHLSIEVRAALSDVLPRVGSALEQAADEKDRGCRERWDGRNGSAAINGGRLVAQVTVRVEKWVCEGPLKTRLARETATLIGSFEPSIDRGRIVVKLVDFETRDLSSLSRELGVEGLISRALQREIDRINADDSLTLLPASLMDEGFAYDAVSFDGANGGTGIVKLLAPTDPLRVMRALSSLIGE
ncbi:MAG: hypothetical protein AAF066_02410 [Pseudomonadota bacterium]